MSDYILEASVTEGIENITVSCTAVQSEPVLLCQAVFYCTNNEAVITRNLSNGVVQNFVTTQLCNVTIRVVSLSGVPQVLQEETFYNITPSALPTNPPPSTSPTPSPPDSECLCVGYHCCVTVIIEYFIIKLR